MANIKYTLNKEDEIKRLNREIAEAGGPDVISEDGYITTDKYGRPIYIKDLREENDGEQVYTC
ncbi:MAG: hypothetical protein KJ674_01060 [Nanoarchaeota archaeon]|nr:hypothetical protein [Nanoarchaeota archaeon]